VEEIAGVKLQRRYNLSAPKGVNGRNSDNTLTRKVLGWEPSTSLRDGIELTYRWIYDQIRAKVFRFQHGAGTRERRHIQIAPALSQ
jgi:nucleoside-diphosphate-sugar epimerase